MSVWSLIGQCLAGVAGIAGGYMINKTNREIAEQNNWTMLQAMREQTKSEQDYNSRSEQMKRDMLAGVHPMLSAGAQPATASSSGIPSLDSPTLQNPFDGVDGVATGMVNTYLREKDLKVKDRSLDLTEAAQGIEALKAYTDLLKSGDITSTEANEIFSTILGNKYGDTVIEDLSRDQFITTKLRNGIESSNLDLAEKRYLFDWLDEFTNARYMFITAQAFESETSGFRNKADEERLKEVSKTEKTIQNLNEEKRKEVAQCIKNLKKQWDVLDFESKKAKALGEDIQKFVTQFDAEIKRIQNLANISEQEAKYWVWSKMLSEEVSWSVGPKGLSVKHGNQKNPGSYSVPGKN